MNNNTAKLARSITWESSKQTFFTGWLVIDRDLIDDFFRAYAYFRWLDDVIDVTSTSDEQRISFMKQQTELIDRLYAGERPGDLGTEEQMLADLIANDRGENSGLQSFIRNMLAIIDFDAYRKGRSVSREELIWYSDSLSKSVTDGMQYFISNGYPYPGGSNRYSAAYGAHITHLLRDTVPDTAEGFINIPAEYMEAHNIGPNDIDSPPYQAWVKERVAEARRCFHEGKRYLDELDVLRCKIAGYWYSIRFEAVLDTVEGDNYILRAEYVERSKISTWIRIAWSGIVMTFRHFLRRSRTSKSFNP